VADLTHVKESEHVSLLDPAQCSSIAAIVFFFERAKAEVTMTERSEFGVATPTYLVAATETPFATARKNALNFMLSAQRLMVGEVLFAASELFERTRTETHLLSEFVSKMAESHSVRDLRTMYQECSKHQIEFVRRDLERLFQHGERLLQTTSNLFAESLRN
jgi:hypothetical protein